MSKLYSLLNSGSVLSLFLQVIPITLLIGVIYAILASMAGHFSSFNTFCGILTVQERNGVRNYEHYNRSQKI